MRGNLLYTHEMNVIYRAGAIFKRTAFFCSQQFLSRHRDQVYDLHPGETQTNANEDAIHSLKDLWGRHPALTR